MYVLLEASVVVKAKVRTQMMVVMMVARFSGGFQVGQFTVGLVCFVPSPCASQRRLPVHRPELTGPKIALEFLQISTFCVSNRRKHSFARYAFPTVFQLILYQLAKYGCSEEDQEVRTGSIPH